MTMRRPQTEGVDFLACFSPYPIFSRRWHIFCSDLETSDAADDWGTGKKKVDADVNV